MSYFGCILRGRATRGDAFDNALESGSKAPFTIYHGRYSIGSFREACVVTMVR